MIAPADLTLVADWAHVTLPRDARDLHVAHERGVDPAIWLRVAIPATRYLPRRIPPRRRLRRPALDDAGAEVSRASPDR